MSSELWVEPCCEAQEEETRLEEQQAEVAEKEEVEVPYGDNQNVGSLRLEKGEEKEEEELGAKHP